MARVNAPFLSFNRGLISRESLARVDLDRTKLSAEVMTNWLPKTQGAMRLRPGTKYIQNTLNDTGAEFIEFYAAVDQVALIELTHLKARVLLDSDTGNTWETPKATGLEVFMSRPPVATTVSFADTGWSNVSTGGAAITDPSDIIPKMTAATTAGVTITASSQNPGPAGGSGFAWQAADDNLNSRWDDTGGFNTTLPSWWNVDFGSGNSQSIHSYSIRAGSFANTVDNAPRTWRLLTGNFDTGTFATDTGKWTLEDERTNEIDWSVSERRKYTLPGADTGSVEARRHWRLYITAVDTGNEAGDLSLACHIAEVEMFNEATTSRYKIVNGNLILNATAIGTIARAQKKVVVDTGDANVEHGLVLDVARGPLTLRVGSAAGDDDYIEEINVGTGYHNLAFTPEGDFYITIQTKETVNRIIRSIAISDSGTVELTTPWEHKNLDDIRYDQSADVVYVDCKDVPPQKIERRGSGRSWSVVEYEPKRGPFTSTATSSAKLAVSHFFGNTTMQSDVPFFSPEHVGALFRMFTPGQSGQWYLGAKDAYTDPIEVTGINDTGEMANNERRVVFSVSGTWVGTVQIQRSFDGPDLGFRPVTGDTGWVTGGGASDTGMTDTGTVTFAIIDPDDNLSVWYRARLIRYVSGVATVNATYKTGGVDGIARVVSYNDNQSVDVEVVDRFSDTGFHDQWQEGSWSKRRGYPTAVALYEGRLAHAGKASLYISVSDDYENFDDSTEGEAGPIVRTFGSGPVNEIFYLVALLRLVAGTSGHEIAIRSSSLDEPLTPDNNSAKAFSSQGSANIRALAVDSRALFVQRSAKKLFSVGFGSALDLVGDYETIDLTLLAPDVLNSGVASIAVQRQPDTRIHCVLTDGTVSILTFEPQEEVLAWYKWQTDTGTASVVERAATLPGSTEDRVYYLVQRTINGVKRRFIERWALETESQGDTGLSFLMDCAASYTDTGRTNVLTGFGHLAGQQVIVWANDTGQALAGKDLSPDDTGGTQLTYLVDTGTGTITLSENVHHAVGGLPYNATFRSAKLAYAAEFGTALVQLKRVVGLAVSLLQTHNNGLYFGSDSGHLDPMPRISDEGAEVDANKIFEELDQVRVPSPSGWHPDSRLHLRARAPRPVTVLAAIPTVATNEKI